MSASRYVSKKLQPFLTQKEELTQQYQKLLKEHEEEEKLNDKYFDELGQWERAYDTLQRTLDEQNKKSHSKSTDVNDQTQDNDAKIEKAVIDTLGYYLLTKSKKESLEALQVREVKKQKNEFELVLDKRLIKKSDEEFEDEEMDQNEYGYVITVKSEGKTLDLKIPASLKTFKDLKSIVKSCFMLEENEIFCTDQMGNLFQDNMVILNELYPPLYDLMRNYQPVVGIEIVKSVNIKDQIHSGDESLMSDDQGRGFFTKKLNFQKKKQEKKINWNLYINYLNTAKIVFEAIIFFVVIGLYLSLTINPDQFATSSQLLIAFRKSFDISSSYSQPIVNISSIINQTLSFSDDINIVQTSPLKSGLIVQTLVQEEKLENCLILNKNQKQIYIDNNQSCLNFDIIQTDDLQGNFTYTDFNPAKYNSQYGGFVWELDLSNKENFDVDIQLLLEQNWKKYNRKTTKFIINYYNSPTKRLIQVIITTIFLFNDLLLNYNTIELQAFNLTKQTDQDKLYNEILLYLTIILLSLSMFDFFGIYSTTTQNNLIHIYDQYNILKIKQRKLQAKKRQLTPSEEQQLQQQQLIISEYFIIKLPIIYLVIRIPLIFDFIYILSNIAIIVRSQIQQIEFEALDQIDVYSEKYQDVSQLITPVFVVRIFTGILVLLLMSSIIRFLGNWSPYLKCYGLVMIRFNKQSSFLLLVLVFLISLSAMSWSITIQGKLMGQENFFYNFIGILRCTLKYGMHNDNAELKLENNYQKDISFSFETRYIQYMIIIVVSFIMVPIFISLMTQQVHNTKIEAKQKMIEMNKEKQE